MKKDNGFTLIELVVGILCSALVTGAIITFMLMGLSTNKSVVDANVDQQNARIMLTMVENLASEGAIHSIDYIGEDSNSDTRDWSILDSLGSAVLSYSASSQSLRGRNGTLLMTGIHSSSVSISDQTLSGCLLNFAIETEAGTYLTSVFCRTKAIQSDELSEDQVTTETTQEASSATNAQSRIDFISSLMSQLGSTGEIKNSPTAETFTLWYCGGEAYLPGWSPDTPWCATFLSWAIAENVENLDYPKDENGKTILPCAADVDNLWTAIGSDKQYIHSDTAPYNITPGDLIFFNWDGDSDLEHVGVVLFTDTDWVYTIEGNSGDRVALRRYDLKDPCIHGYGVLNWKTT